MGLALLISIFLFLPSSVSWAQGVLLGKIYTLEGKVEVSRDDGASWKDATRFEDIFKGDLIRTGELGRVSILLVDQTMMKIGPKSLVKVVEAVPSEKIEMGKIVKAALAKLQRSLYKVFRGKIWLRSQAVFELETPVVAVGVRGTELVVLVEDDGETVVSMIEGMAEVRNPYGAIVIAAGEGAVAKVGLAPVKKLLVRPEDAVQWALFYPAVVSYRDYFFVSSNSEELNGRLEELRARMDRMPWDTGLWVDLGRVFHDLGLWEEAKEAFGKALHAPETRRQALEGLGWVELQKGNLDGALSFFRGVLPWTEMSALGESLALWSLGRGSSSLEVVERAIREFGKTPKLLVQRAFVMLSYGMVEGAVEDLQEASRAGETLALGLHSNVLLVLNRKEEALRKALEAVRLNPWSSSARVDLAWARQAHFDLRAALDEVQKAVELDSRNTRALLTYSQLLFGFGRLKESQEIAQRILAINPREGLAYSLLGFVLLARKDIDGAKEAFSKAVELDQNSSQPHLGLGIAYMREGEKEKALEEMLVATMLEPTVSVNYTYLGKALYQVGELESGVKMLKRAKELDPRDPSPHLYSGIINTDLNRAGEAIRDLERAVELNDNRAVYRASFLLDEDRAVKNVNLARTYEALGLTAIARNRALLSLKDDPNNSSAHLFLANALSAEKDRTAAAGSELLKFLLLMPANLNSFNTFNEYTSFFETPTVGGTVEAWRGNQQMESYSLNTWGSWKDIAAREILVYSRDSGYKRNNFERSWMTQTTFKWAPMLEHEFLFNFLHTHFNRGDQSQDLNYFAREDWDETFEAPSSTYTLGYHWRVSPTSDVLLVLRRDEVDALQEDGPLSEESVSVGPGATMRQRFSRLDFRQRYWHVGATHLFHLGDHRINSGIEVLEGESEAQDFLLYSYRSLPGSSLKVPMLMGKNRIEPFFLSLFVQDTWRIGPRLTLEAGVFYERTNDGSTVPLFSSREFRKEMVSPRVGIIYQPAVNHTLRVGYARYLQAPFISPESLRPMDIVGFTVGQNAVSSALQEDVSVGWDWMLAPGIFLRTEGFRRTRTEQREDPFSETFRGKEREFRGGKIEFNIMLLDWLGFAPSYSFARNIENEFSYSLGTNPKRWRDDHEVRLGWRFLHPSGWKGGIVASYINQKLHGFERSSPDDFWVVDIWLHKELLRKKLVLGAEVRNLFDQKFRMEEDVLNVVERFPNRQFMFFARYNF